MIRLGHDLNDDLKCIKDEHTSFGRQNPFNVSVRLRVDDLRQATLANSGSWGDKWGLIHMGRRSENGSSLPTTTHPWVITLGSAGRWRWGWEIGVGGRRQGSLFPTDSGEHFLTIGGGTADDIFQSGSHIRALANPEGGVSTYCFFALKRNMTRGLVKLSGVILSNIEVLISRCWSRTTSQKGSTRTLEIKVGPKFGENGIYGWIYPFIDGKEFELISWGFHMLYGCKVLLNRNKLLNSTFKL